MAYDGRNHILTAGLNLRPADRFGLGLQVNFTDSQAGMDPIDLSRPDFTARFPLVQLDFSQTHTYSLLDTSGVDLWADARYRFTNRFFVRGAYRYVDFNDDTAYLYDTTGTNNLVYFTLGFNF